MTVVVLAGAMVATSQPAVALGPNAIRSGFDSTVFPGNDDGSTTVSLPFSPDFFGTTYNQLFLNNNGNVTFDQALSVFTPFDLSTAGRVIIAPFFADVDTSVGNPVTYGSGTVDGHSAWGANWPGVGCFNGIDSVLDNFQVILINRSDVAAGDFDIEFNYDQIQWEAGQASGGDANCLGGSSARAGYSDGTAPNTFELPGSGVNGAFLDSNPVTGLVHTSRNSSQLGRYVFSVRGGQPQTPTLVTSIVGTPDPVSAGNDVSYTITAQNNGASAVSGVQITDTLPATTTLVSASSGCAGSGPVTCSLGTIGPSSSASANLVVRTATGSGGTTVTDSATTSPGGSTGSFDTHIVAPSPGSASGFVPPGGSITTGGNNPATLTLPNVGPGAAVQLTQAPGNFCAGPCVGPATGINSFPGYRDPNLPISLKLGYAEPNLVHAAFDFLTQNLYKQPDSPPNAAGVKIADCADNPAWTTQQKRAAALRRVLRLGTGSGIANPSPCVDSRSITSLPHGQWQLNFTVLYLSGDPHVGRR